MDHLNDKDIDACNRRFLSERSIVQERTNQNPWEVTIHSVGDLVRIVELCHTGSYQYRGQRCDWPLRPGLTRAGGPIAEGLGRDETWQDKERSILTEFRRQAIGFYGLAERRGWNDFETAFLAQHHLADTRLLDWTLNPLAALFFAVKGPFDSKDDEGHIKEKGFSIVWAIAKHREPWSTARECYSCFDTLPEEPVFVLPDHTTNRAAVQQSIFALWKYPRKPLDVVLGGDTASNMWKIKVPQDRRQHIQWMLHCHGINEATLFPDLDGLGRYSAWKHQRVWEDEYKQHGKPKPKDIQPT